jgi:hypothetical protein
LFASKHEEDYDSLDVFLYYPERERGWLDTPPLSSLLHIRLIAVGCDHHIGKGCVIIVSGAVVVIKLHRLTIGRGDNETGGDWSSAIRGVINGDRKPSY